MRASIDLDPLGRTYSLVDPHVLQPDGGIRIASLGRLNLYCLRIEQVFSALSNVEVSTAAKSSRRPCGDQQFMSSCLCQ
jgi:hypothetical protein